MPLPEGPRDIMQMIIDEAAAHTLSEGELKLLLTMQISNATDAIDDEKYGMALAFLEDAVGYARSLLIVRGKVAR